MISCKYVESLKIINRGVGSARMCAAICSRATNFLKNFKNLSQIDYQTSETVN